MPLYMDKNPKDYWDESDGLITPELYFQYQHPDTPYTQVNGVLAHGQSITFDQLKELKSKYLGASYNTVSSLFTTGASIKEVVEIKSGYDKGYMWIERTGTLARARELEKKHDEDEDCKDYVKFNEMDRVTAIFIVFNTDGEFLNKLDDFCDEVEHLCHVDNDDEDNLVFTLGVGIGGGPSLDPHYMTLETYGEDIIESNYNDDFKPAYDTILQFLKQGKSSGLVILDGEAGTGKTSIIKHFISMCSRLDRRIAIVPSAFANILSDPAFLSFANNQLKDTILILEDAENALAKVESGTKSDSVSNLLNISDGILGSIMSIKIIATVNSRALIDDNLLRKGRLVADYTFNKLSIEKSKELAGKLGVDPDTIESDSTLADIYNVAPNKFNEVETKTVGFHNRTIPVKTSSKPISIKTVGFGGRS